MRNTQQGFTLIELVVVIVILGILSAVALPKFVNMSSEAGNAAAAGTAGAVSSGSAINYSKSLVGLAGSFTPIISGTSTCAVLEGLLVGGLPADITFTAHATTITCANGVSTACTLEHSKGTIAATVSAICTI